MNDRKEHWENIYKTKNFKDVSWYQEKPETSIIFIKQLNIKKDAAIIDVGGGDSYLADYLLAEGYSNITVLDISEEALKKAQARLKDKAVEVKWIVADVSSFEPKETYDVWHDRAALHFLTEDNKVAGYVKNLEAAVRAGGFVVLGTFSEKGPEKCSGIKIRQYSLQDMKQLLDEKFEVLHCENLDHKTPSGSLQNFSFCSFNKIH